jgi:hypothetical protein
MICQYTFMKRSLQDIVQGIGNIAIGAGIALATSEGTAILNRTITLLNNQDLQAPLYALAIHGSVGGAIAAAGTIGYGLVRMIHPNSLNNYSPKYTSKEII